jgi:hypothetical protein
VIQAIGYSHQERRQLAAKKAAILEKSERRSEPLLTVAADAIRDIPGLLMFRWPVLDRPHVRRLGWRRRGGIGRAEDVLAALAGDPAAHSFE